MRTEIVTKEQALNWLSAQLREVQDPNEMCELLDLYAQIAGWYKHVGKQNKRRKKAKA